MNSKTRLSVRGFAALTIALVVSLLVPTLAHAQDAFNCSPIIPIDTTPLSLPRESKDPFQPEPLPELPGRTTGIIEPTAEQKQETENISTITGDGIRVPGDEFRKATRLPDSRVLLGQSICDLSYRPIACDEVKASADLPPLPKQITLPRQLTGADIKSDAEPGRPLGYAFSLNPSANFAKDEYGRQQVPAEVVVPAVAVQAMSDANYLAACNPDYSSRFAAYCMELEHTGKVPAYLRDALADLRQAELAIPAAFSAMAKLKLAIAKVDASTDPPAKRAELAAKLERAGDVFEALVERLRCVDLLNDGPSRLQLAKLYNRLQEPKLAFETLREAAEKTWSKDKANQLAEVHFLLGRYISMMATAAIKHGNNELYMVRVQNASACFRRAICLDRTNQEAVRELVSVAKQAVSLDDSFDNQLMLGGAYFIAGDLERAKSAYDECRSKNTGDKRLAQGLRLLEQSSKQAKKNGAVQLSASGTVQE